MEAVSRRPDPIPSNGDAAVRLGPTAVVTAGGHGGVRVDTAAGDPPGGTDVLARAAARVGAVTGAFAGLVAFLYVIGGAVMWIRFRSAGLPADQAVSLVPRDQLVVVALRVLVLPAALSGALILVLAQRQQRRQSACPTWRRIPRRASLCWLGAVVVLVLVVPLTPGALAWPLAALALWIGWHRWVSEAFDPAHPRSFPILRAVGLAIVLSAAVSLARQFDRPVQLPSATIQDSERRAHTGVLVSASGDQVAIGMGDDGAIRIFARAQLRTFAVGHTLDRRAPAASLLSRFVGGGAWAATPLELWCDGERYDLWDVAELCRTQPSVARSSARVEGGAVTTVVACPPEAREGCSGFLRLVTADRYAVRSLDRFATIVLGTSEFQIPPAQELPVQIELRPEARAVLGQAGPIVALDATIALDRAGEAVVARGRLDACFPAVRLTRDRRHVAGPRSCGDRRAAMGGARRPHEEPEPEATPQPTPTPDDPPAPDDPIELGPRER